MSYVDALYSRDDDRIYVVERTASGDRAYREYAADYTFYYADPKGKQHGLGGESVTRFSTRKRREFEKERRVHGKKQLYESDVNQVFRCLSQNYLGVESPKLNVCFFDIEANFDTERGYAPTNDPFNSVTAISMYLEWEDQLITLVIAPPTISTEEADAICAEFDNTLRFDNEIDMFNAFFELIENADVVTGWNSEGYDVPYLVNRVIRVMSKDDTRRFCLLKQMPKAREYERYGKVEVTYDLVGRVHMDYLQLYKKYNYESRHSYSLDAIGELEVGERKTPYEGTLDQLYKRDFKQFIVYNRQDVMLMVKIHRKTKFLELANQLAHENTVLLPTVMGSVAMIEQAIINEAHSRGLVVPDKVRKEQSNEQKAAGAYVATPQRGIHEYVGAVDINSLYPSVIRALNLAPETIVGQVRQTLTDEYMQKRARELAQMKRKPRDYDEFSDGGDDDDDATSSLLWEGLFASLEYTAVMEQKRDVLLWIDYSDGRSEQYSAAQIWKMVFDSNNPWILTANGTIFTHEVEGVIPGLLSKWYSERKEIQKKLKGSTTKEDIEYYDKRQLVRKILLNSAYGALLNVHCRFYDKRIGQSVTLSGRQIVRHMMSHINEQVCGEYSHTGPSIVYGDTDSCYFTAYPTFKSEIETGTLQWSKETAITVYDHIADQVNNSFPDFMYRAFHAPHKNGTIIKAGRELIGDRALFITKKRYAINIYDKEGTRLDVEGKRGKIKAMGLDLKRSDTPKYVQVFLSGVLDMVLAGSSREEVIQTIKNFKDEFGKKNGWLKGSPKSANKLTYYGELLERDGKVNMPGHIRASLNWNWLRRAHGDNYSMKIVDGMKIIVCKLRPNALGFTSIAYPTDELRLPEWFTSLPFDDIAMQEVLIDKKVDNLLGGLEWDLRRATVDTTNLVELFSFD